MSGLVQYGSSDEEDDPRGDSAAPLEVKTYKPGSESQKSSGIVSEDSKTNGSETISLSEDSRSKAVVGTDAPMIGPALGPSEAVNSSVSFPLQDEGEESAPSSPYSANRALLRQLTLPPVPNYDIPPSPPGSPPESTNTKFAHFLKLKKQGVHFNEKLAKSSALKNPSLMQKLMDFADIDEADQYSSTLPEELWNPRGFPDWAYKEELAKSQQQILKKREEEKVKGSRESIDFVPSTASGHSSRSGTPGASTGPRVGPKSAVERVMAGLDRPTSPQIQSGMKRKTRFES